MKIITLQVHTHAHMRICLTLADLLIASEINKELHNGENHIKLVTMMSPLLNPRKKIENSLLV